VAEKQRFAGNKVASLGSRGMSRTLLILGERQPFARLSPARGRPRLIATLCLRVCQQPAAGPRLKARCTAPAPTAPLLENDFFMIARSAKFATPSPLRSAVSSVPKNALFILARSLKFTMLSLLRSASQALP